MTSFFFYILAMVLVFASLAVVLARNPVYSVLSLVTAIFALASLFIILEAFFVSAILLLVYAGAVLVLFLFVIMLLNLHRQEVMRLKQGFLRPLGFLIGVSFLSELFWVIQAYRSSVEPTTSFRGTAEVIGQTLFTEYLLPFELTSFLLLAAIFGIVVLAKRHIQ